MLLQLTSELLEEVQLGLRISPQGIEVVSVKDFRDSRREVDKSVGNVTSFEIGIGSMQPKQKSVKVIKTIMI